MADYRCPKHDRIFETVIDHRKPGALAIPGKLPAHPKDGHPDCPKCQEEKSTVSTTIGMRISNRSVTSDPLPTA